MIDELAMLLGGRVAEELWFLDPTTGASNDIEKATQVARKMVCEYGMSDRLGSLVLGTKQENVFLGRDFGHQQDYSEQVAFEIDKEMRRLIDEAHAEAEQILTTYRDVADAMVEALMEKETIGKEELAQILAPVVKRLARGIMAPPPGHVRSNGGRSRRRGRHRPGSGRLAVRLSALPGGGFDPEKVERGVRLILEGIGEDLDRDGLRDTPARVARMYEEITSGLRTDPTWRSCRRCSRPATTRW